LDLRLVSNYFVTDVFPDKINKKFISLLYCIIPYIFEGMERLLSSTFVRVSTVYSSTVLVLHTNTCTPVQVMRTCVYSLCHLYY
jgi:hypothetical protein